MSAAREPLVVGGDRQDRLNDARAHIEAAAVIIAASVLGDESWDLADVDLQVGLLRLLDRAAWHLDRATIR